MNSSSTANPNDAAKFSSQRTETRGERAFSIRTPERGYLAALVICVFYASLAVYSGFETLAVLTLLLGFAVAAVAITERTVYDGKRLRNAGLLKILAARFAGYRITLRVKDAEFVETHPVRRIKRGGRVFYRYRTSIGGRGAVFTFLSNGTEKYRGFLRSVLSQIPTDALDNNSLELRDHLREPSRMFSRAVRSDIPSSDVLEGMLKRPRTKKRAIVPVETLSALERTERVVRLRRIANELRVAGALLRAIETFRRAAVLTPLDPWLLFEFARCLQHYAGAERDQRVKRRAIAMLRLAEKRAGSDGILLGRLGESYFESGQWKRASGAFKKAVAVSGEGFRTTRGLAELALRDGRIAHVIHNFSAAKRLAGTPALRRWSNGELEYFSRLNDDEEYMELEIGRVNLLDSLDRTKMTIFRIALFGIPLIVAGIAFGETIVADLGWAVSAISIFIWLIISLVRRMFVPRIDFDLLEED